MTREELMDLFREAAGDAHAAPLASKWEGGVIQLVPANRERGGWHLEVRLDGTRGKRSIWLADAELHLLRALPGMALLLG